MFKSWFPESRDMLPLTWWKQHPIYLSAILAIVGAVSMVVYAVLGFDVILNLVFSFDSAFKEWHIWTPFTYAFANPPSIWTVLGCYLLWRFGEAVERHFGRLIFVKLLLLLLIISPIAITLLHLVGFQGLSCAGMMELEFGVFMAFATLYPRAKINLIILTLDAWVLAVIFVGVSALSSISGRDWGSLILLAANVGSAYAFIRYQKGDYRFPTIIKIIREPKEPTKTSVSRIDEILDKISRDGIDSITAEERSILDKASGQK